MAAYVDWYFAWLYRLVSQREDTHVFAFGTAVEDLSAAMRQPYGDAVASLYETIEVWGSGTAIGQALKRWDERYGRMALGSSSHVMVISDGWDVGRPEDLETVLKSLAQRSHQLWWLNPLMITRGFEPRTRALKIAMHYVSRMTSGATQEDVRRISWMLGLSG